jgi:hypothetical protein
MLLGLLLNVILKECLHLKHLVELLILLDVILNLEFLASSRGELLICSCAPNLRDSVHRLLYLLVELETRPEVSELQIDDQLHQILRVG